MENLECALCLQEADAGSEGPPEATEMVCRACYPHPQDLIGKRTAKQGLVCSRHFPSEEQRHTEPEWVALGGCEAPHLGTAVQVQGQQPRVAMVTEGLHLK